MDTNTLTKQADLEKSAVFLVPNRASDDFTFIRIGFDVITN